mmetsp:Transcript_5318/g.7659  ORF Transcript_5318/g.7659 Transcript_5318/m.7659 type:complete len:147 (-) Transcript_5318:183-623(-)|eukprot:CAMPEP_0194202822 /NCGR_PEP_ID=MMETSP0156-20130528/2752_1 /TAXON_ID=33649 /ORGANISM="Thalassionema nitzschioides, Strain L26-B" /LENGTH=146 /DNA_ID=CAMNT_0038928425 /DNA_START=86 /DNA_END=526 /DNA_ORIENTATION=-
MNKLIIPVARYSRLHFARSLTSITYSGGQAIEGQGGFYGSGGARVALDKEALGNKTSELLALAGDVERVSFTMRELEKMESRFEEESKEGHSSKNFELRNSIKKMMTTSEFLESLSRLEIKGEPVWGLSESEREMIILAREKVNSS